MATVVSKTSIKIDELLADVVVNAQVVDGYLIVTTRNGSQVNAGPVGGDGTAWYSGSGAPSASSYAIGDFYLDKDTGEVYQKTSAATWMQRANLKGPTGDPGENGARWHVGSGLPPTGLGAVEDFYIDASTGEFHRKVTDLAWELSGSLKGPVGDEGPIGPDGTVYVDEDPPPPGQPEGHMWWDPDDDTNDLYNWADVEIWSSSSDYFATSPKSVVVYNGETYAAVGDSFNVIPGTDSTKWLKVAAKGLDGVDGVDGLNGADSSALVSDTAPTVMGDGSPLEEGVIWIEPDAGSWVMNEVYARQAMRMLRGGGRRYLGSGTLSWGQPFYTRGAGRKSGLAPSGYHEIAMPPLGLVIQKVGVSGQSVTVSADGVVANPAGRYIPLAPGETLWYALPLGSSFNTVGTFYITAATPTLDFEIPETWVPIVSRNPNYPTIDRSSHVWGDGQEDSQWTAPTMINGWVNYNTNAYSAIGWRKVNGLVYWKGLIANGTSGSTICSLDPQINGNMQNNGIGADIFSSYQGTAASGVGGRVDAYADRLVHSLGGNSYVSLAGIVYWNG